MLKLYDLGEGGGRRASPMEKTLPEIINLWILSKPNTLLIYFNLVTFQSLKCRPLTKNTYVLTWQSPISISMLWTSKLYGHFPYLSAWVKSYDWLFIHVQYLFLILTTINFFNEKYQRFLLCHMHHAWHKSCSNILCRQYSRWCWILMRQSLFVLGLRREDGHPFLPVMFLWHHSSDW